MTITIQRNGSVLTLAVEGRLDTNTSPALEKELADSLNGISELYIDLAQLVYISSAGLRVLLTAQKTMSRQGKMVLKNTNADLMEIFEVTGFVDILTFE